MTKPPTASALPPSSDTAQFPQVNIVIGTTGSGRMMRVPAAVLADALSPESAAPITPAQEPRA